MFDRITEKIIEKNLGSPLSMLSINRKKELESIKDKIRTDPEQVELWFDKEIKKVENQKLQDIIKSVMDTK
ncbi:MAG: hypothetical protein R3321_13120 [Nitrososphaeraceae archaeon]|nr:hypothetical protein [Nitrososphaeraceae archaeon]